MDVDHDGLLTPKEIGRCCKYMGMDISDEQELIDIVRKKGCNLGAISVICMYVYT